MMILKRMELLINGIKDIRENETIVVLTSSSKMPAKLELKFALSALITLNVQTRSGAVENVIAVFT